MEEICHTCPLSCNVHILFWILLQILSFCVCDSHFFCCFYYNFHPDHFLLLFRFSSFFSSVYFSSVFLSLSYSFHIPLCLCICMSLPSGCSQGQYRRCGLVLVQVHQHALTGWEPACFSSAEEMKRLFFSAQCLMNDALSPHAQFQRCSDLTSAFGQTPSVNQECFMRKPETWSCKKHQQIFLLNKCDWPGRPIKIHKSESQLFRRSAILL